ncbi:MAG: response regulator transcription factor [Calditrichaeota bacterium]|nr:response regulator transcription factor [Calditrichota bacterium]
MITDKIKIALAEDNRRLAQGIIEKLNSCGSKIVFCFHEPNGEALLKRLEREPEIDVILMDIEMPKLDGIEATALIKQRFPKLKVIMLTVFDDDDKILQSIQAGASGYLLKDITTEKLYEGILLTAEGGAPMSPPVAFKALKMLRSADVPAPEGSAEKNALTRRETEILEHICNGMNYRQIAEALIIAPATVRKHIANIYQKLQVQNKMQAVAKARRQRLI